MYDLFANKEENIGNYAPQKGVKIFYCYAHKDRTLRDELEKHLDVLRRSGQIIGWYDKQIEAGTNWKGEIDYHLTTSDIILLLVSSDFMGSDYCYSVEMQRALELHQAGFLVLSQSFLDL